MNHKNKNNPVQATLIWPKDYEEDVTMALSESSKRDNNVTSLAQARRRRSPGTPGSSHCDKHTDPPEIDLNSSGKLVGDSTDTATTQQVEIKSSGKTSRISKRRFDRVKVERIKAELANGTYQIDHHRVADKFIEHERNG